MNRELGYFEATRSRILLQIRILLQMVLYSFVAMSRLANKHELPDIMPSNLNFPHERIPKR